MLLKKEIIENINKVPFLSKKMETIENLLEKEEFAEAYKAVAALIEIVCIQILESKYRTKVEDSNIVLLASLLEQHGEKELKERLVSINGEYEQIKLSKVKEFDVIALLSNLDDIVRFLGRT